MFGTIQKHQSCICHKRVSLHIRLGYKYQVTSTKLQVPSYKYQNTSTKLQVPSYKYQVTSTKLQVPSYRYQVLNTIHQVTIKI
jgi:hypothetical protein